MSDKLKKILKVIAVTGIVTAGVLALIGNKEIQKHFKEGMEKLNKHLKKEHNDDDDEDDDAKAQLLLIAKQINRDIKNTERRTSPKAHERNQKKFDKIKWGHNIVSRDDIIKN